MLSDKENLNKSNKNDDIGGESTEFRVNLIRNDKLTFLNRLNEIRENYNVEFMDNKYRGLSFIHNWKCLQCNNIYKTTYYHISHYEYKCPVCFPNELNMNLDILKIVKDILPNETIIENSTDIIPNHLIDIYIPSKNLAIHYNRIYLVEEGKVGKSFLIDKTNACDEKGIRLIHIYEDEWLFKQEIVINRLKRIIGVFDEVIKVHARKCKIYEINPSIKNDFLNKYHIQGSDNAILKLGAFYNKKLIAVMTFSKGSIAKGSKTTSGTWELNRFAIHSEFQANGIASKLLMHFKRNYEWTEIFSYADRRWSTGDVYKKLGFEFVYMTEENYWYLIDFKRKHRFALRKRSDEPKDVTEIELRMLEGYVRVFDSGNVKFGMANNGEYVYKKKENNLLSF
jgi:GNAT superfamily N-acetyltransferase